MKTTLLILAAIGLMMQGCVTWHSEDISGTTDVIQYDLTKPKAAPLPECDHDSGKYDPDKCLDSLQLRQH